MHADPKSAKKLLNLTVFFALSGSAGVKAARRMLVKLSPAGDCESNRPIEIRGKKIACFGFVLCNDVETLGSFSRWNPN